MAARDLHDLLRCWEVWDRFWCASAHMQHLLYRQETRWPGYYYRGDFPEIDDENWRCFVNSRYDVTTNTWTMVDWLRPHVESVTVVHPPHVKLITKAKVMTDKKASLALAKLHAAGLWATMQHDR